MAFTSLSFFSGRVLGELVTLSVSSSMVQVRLDHLDCAVSLRVKIEELGKVEVHEIGASTTLFVEDMDGIVLAGLTMAPDEARRAERLINGIREPLERAGR